jgi:hypothetical protein
MSSKVPTDKAVRPAVISRSDVKAVPLHHTAGSARPLRLYPQAYLFVVADLCVGCLHGDCRASRIPPCSGAVLEIQEGR